MAFEKGHAKLPNAGRKKGTPNKNTLNIADRLNSMNFDVIGELILLCKSTKDEKIRSKILMHLSEFIFPKRKAIEVSGDNPFADKSVEELKEAVIKHLCIEKDK